MRTREGRDRPPQCRPPASLGAPLAACAGVPLVPGVQVSRGQAPPPQRPQCRHPSLLTYNPGPGTGLAVAPRAGDGICEEEKWGGGGEEAEGGGREGGGEGGARQEGGGEGDMGWGRWLWRAWGLRRVASLRTLAPSFLKPLSAFPDGALLPSTVAAPNVPPPHQRQRDECPQAWAAGRLTAVAPHGLSPAPAPPTPASRCGADPPCRPPLLHVQPHSLP